MRAVQRGDVGRFYPSKPLVVFGSHPKLSYVVPKNGANIAKFLIVQAKRNPDYLRGRGRESIATFLAD